MALTRFILYTTYGCFVGIWSVQIRRLRECTVLYTVTKFQEKCIGLHFEDPYTIRSYSWGLDFRRNTAYAPVERDTIICRYLYVRKILGLDIVKYHPLSNLYEYFRIDMLNNISGCITMYFVIILQGSFSGIFKSGDRWQMCNGAVYSLFISAVRRKASRIHFPNSKNTE
jgi:hypothetical protein